MPAARPSPRLRTLWREHRQFYESFEAETFDRARRFYQGKFHTGGSRGLYATKNIVYAIADSAISSLIGSNPSVSPIPRNAAATRVVKQAQGLMDWILDTNRIRRRLSLAVLDAVLCGRGVLKTGWDAVTDAPIIRPVDPSRLFFDLTARDPDEISYFMEATVIPMTAFEARVAAGRYRRPENLKPDRYPDWLLNTSAWGNPANVNSVGAWVSVVEVYDRETNTVTHYSDQYDEVLYEGEASYIPYDMFFLNHSGTDCRGLSEVSLVLDQQQTINDMLTLLKRISYLQIPRILYDSGRITGEDLNKAVEANLGAFVPLRLKSPELGRNLGAAFFPMPYPEHPAGVAAFKAMNEEDAAFVSALTKASRGEIENARTASEVMFVESKIRNRLVNREGNVNDAFEGAAARAFWLAQRYMTKPKFVRIAQAEWAEIGAANLRDVHMDWRMVAHNPARTNPAVQAETLMQALPVLMQAPNVDQAALVEELVGLMGINARFLRPADAPSAPAGPAPSEIPPELLAALQGAPPPAVPDAAGVESTPPGLPVG